MQITNNELQVFLSEHFKTDNPAIEPVIGHGEWSRTFFFNGGGRRMVIRFSAYDEDFRKDRFVARYSKPNLPIPKIEEIGNAFDMFYAVSPRVDGTMIDHLNAAEMRACIPSLMSLFNALREVEGSQTEGYGGFDADGNGSVSSWRDYLSTMTGDSPDSRLHGWKENLARNKTADEIYWQGRRRLLNLIPLCPEERHLIHNDLLHFNLIMRDKEVAAVIDWGCALWGDFLYDLAMFTCWQFYYPAMAGIDFVAEARQSFAMKNVALPHYLERLQCYQLHLMLDSLAYNAWKGESTNLEITVKRLSEILNESTT